VRQSPSGRSPITAAPRSSAIRISSRQTGRRRSLRLFLAAIATVWLFVAPAVHGSDRSVVVLHATGIVDNVMAGYIAEGIAGAERSGAAAVVIELDTPGGALEAMNHIVQSIQGSSVPTVVWVSPAGAKAASAGTFITLAANLAYMAPSTTIGAASPVGAGGEDIGGTEEAKVRNYAISYIKAIAEERGHNVEWAISTVESAVSSSANDAVAIGAVNGLASSIDELLTKIDGQTVTVDAGVSATIDVTGATLTDASMNPLQEFLHLLSDPNIAALFFTVGTYGLIYEVINPNFVTGILGALSVILGLIGFGSLPLNVGALLLIILGIVLFGLEITVTSHGLLAVGGVVCFVLGLSALYTAPLGPTGPDVSVALPLIATMAITTALFMLVAIGTVVRHRHRLRLAPAGYGAGGGGTVPLGTTGEVRVPLAPDGTIYAAGEEWSARAAAEPSAAAGSVGPPLPRGTHVTVVGQQGLTLIVAPDRSAGPAA
jgi:membrane-bound serine protease (ClpP class)